VPSARLPSSQAIALGLLQGPTELLPISSSAHTALLPWLAGWRYGELDPQLRKAFEVALHAGGGLALAIDMRAELLRGALELDARRATVVALSLAPPALAGMALGETIERRLGDPRSIAAALAFGALAMALADAGAPASGRRQQDAGALDGLALGLAQAAALVPGVSRNGATLTAARARLFAREDAHALSWHAALPVMLGASVLKAAQLLARGSRAGDIAATNGARRAPLPKRTIAMGAASAFVSTLVSARLLRFTRRAERALAPYSIYRGLLAALVLARQRAERRANAPTVNR
jgi:undecaprenyl-diphosphatase